MKKIILLASAAMVMPTAAYAQSAGSVDFEKNEVVVTGNRAQQVGGVQAPDTTKAKSVLTQEMISRQNAGQTILDTVNLVPGVSFQNNDAYGSSGGTLTIRGFDSSRVSLTFDGVPLNDSGNYAIYSNQQLDPELIEQVNVNLGTTDVDSPTASAVGGTVNYRTRTPGREFGGRVVTSIGEYNFRRAFAMVDTGDLTASGLRGFVAASFAKNDNPFNNYGKVRKQQYNAKLYQPLSGGDFIALSGHYNQNRNNFFGSLPLRWDMTQSATNPAVRVVGSGSSNRFPTNNDEREYNINYPCGTDVPQANVTDVANSCGTEFDRRYNPSNTGNVRLQSRFALTDKLTLNVEPSFQYVKANGGGTVTGREGFRTVGGVNYTGFIGGTYYFGRDLNGDGDTLDRQIGATSGGVTLLAPSQTRTRRVGLISGLRYELSDTQSVRLAYTFDRANHRQTGELTGLDNLGNPLEVFAIDMPIADFYGNNVQKRDRKSLAILNQLSAEYRGEFGGLTVNAGARMPFFKRDLTNYCFTSSAGGFVDCFGQNPALEASYAAANPYNFDATTNKVTGIAPPDHRVLKYNKLLPNIGAIYDLTPRLSAFGNYAKGLSVPGTDNLYNAFYFPAGTPQARPNPETTDSFDGGLRFRSNKIQAQLAGWFTRFNDRLASAYDPELNQTVYRNLGRVNKMGIDASISWKPVEKLTTYAFASVNDSEIRDNVQIGNFLPAGTTCDTANPTTQAAIRSCAFTAGTREAGTPKYTFGGSIYADVGPFNFGITTKRTGPRAIFDNNQPVYRGTVGGPQDQIFPAEAPAYWLANLDIRFDLGTVAPELAKSFFQLNVYNLTDAFYVGGFGGGLSQSLSGTSWGSPPFVQVGAPRTVSGTLSFGF